jgi:hypothetical protein
MYNTDVNVIYMYNGIQNKNNFESLIQKGEARGWAWLKW